MCCCESLVYIRSTVVLRALELSALRRQQTTPLIALCRDGRNAALSFLFYQLPLAPLNPQW